MYNSHRSVIKLELLSVDNTISAYLATLATAWILDKVPYS